MRFFRRNGQVIPIRDGNDDGKMSVKKAGAAGAAVGAAYHVGHEAILDAQASNIRNNRGWKTFKDQLKPGDIILNGTSPRHSTKFKVYDSLVQYGGINYVPKPLHKWLKKAAYTNSDLLNAMGTGKNYHAGIYVGDSLMAQIGGEGGYRQRLSTITPRSNVQAFRFTDAKPAEIRRAVDHANKVANLKGKILYHDTKDMLRYPFAAYIFPHLNKVVKEPKTKACPNLVVDAFKKRKFKYGEYTLTGDLRKAKGLKIVARMERVPLPGRISLIHMAGAAGKGLKWGVPAAVGAYAINKAFLERRHKDA